MQSSANLGAGLELTGNAKVISDSCISRLFLLIRGVKDDMAEVGGKRHVTRIVLMIGIPARLMRMSSLAGRKARRKFKDAKGS